MRAIDTQQIRCKGNQQSSFHIYGYILTDDNNDYKIETDNVVQVIEGDEIEFQRRCCLFLAMHFLAGNCIQLNYLLTNN